MKHVILCADDFAFNAAVSRGIVALAQKGRLSAASAMTLSPRWAQDAPALKELQGRLDVGLHLDWTSPFAAQAGHGRSLPWAMLTALLGGFDKNQARPVIERQLDAFERVWQAPPSHIDGHQHVQQFKGIREALVEIIAKRYSHLPAGTKPYLRVSQDPTGQADLKSRVIAALGSNAIKSIAIQSGIATATDLFGIYDFTGGEARYARLIARWLTDAPAGCIIMCHPAQGAVTAGDGGDGIAAARQWEFDYLASDAFAQALDIARASLQPAASTQR